MEFIIIFVALLPAVLLMLYITRADSLQPEPKSALAKAFGWGVLSLIIALPIAFIFAAIHSAPEESLSIFDAIWKAFFEAAIPEEFAKLVCLYLCVRKNKYFDEYLDGIVYAAFVGLGFAAVENIMYLFAGGNWIVLGIMRGLLAVPGHFFDAVIMGYFFSLWWYKRDRKYALLMYFAPVLAHGIYDFLCFSIQISEYLILLFIPAICYFMYKLRKYGLKYIAEHKATDNEMMVIVEAEDIKESESTTIES